MAEAEMERKREERKGSEIRKQKQAEREHICQMPQLMADWRH